MSTQEQKVQFAAEMKQRFEDFANWAVSASTASGNALNTGDFEPCRKEIAKLAERDFDIGERNAAIPEPSEDGPQYVSVSPAPWP